MGNRGEIGADNGTKAPSQQILDLNRFEKESARVACQNVGKDAFMNVEIDHTLGIIPIWGLQVSGVPLALFSH